MIVQNALNRDVQIHDDNSQPSMSANLRIGPADAPEVAIECVSAVNRTYTETWNVGPANGSVTPSLSLAIGSLKSRQRLESKKP